MKFSKHSSLLPFVFVAVSAMIAACSTKKEKASDPALAKQQVGAMLDSFNAAAARADYNAYFSYFADSATFMGTDATEHWDKKSFMTWAKPYFERGRAWNFTAIQRHVYLAPAGDWGWFDELLNTQMKICRGSGVVVKQGNEWKLEQYVLSMTIPNALTDSIVPLKAPVEDSLMKVIKSK